MQFYNHLSNLEQLHPNDFIVFYSGFLRTIERKFAHFSALHFIHKGEGFPELIQQDELVERVSDYQSEKPAGQSLYCCVDNTIVFSLKAASKKSVVVLDGVDSYIAGRVSLDWLEKLAGEINDQLLLVKRAGIDLATGLYNDIQFYTSVESLRAATTLSVLFLEIYPQARSTKEAQLHTAKVSRLLQHHLEEGIPVFHIGYHTFALITTSSGSEDFTVFANTLFLKLRRENFRKIHVGICSENRQERIEQENIFKVVDGANDALQAALKRGPFALCDHEHLRNPDSHPLRKPSSALIAKGRRRWRNCELFSMVLLDFSNHADVDPILTKFPSENLLSEGRLYYLFMPETAPEDALAKISEVMVGNEVDSVRIGVAFYPHHSFSKSSVLHNCLKAVRHAEFYGPSGAAVLDEVSFNVSGDIYYAEGDLKSAVREYREGLKCNGDNINLLNSLGVAYADMVRHKQALEAFEKVISFDDSNFMALYNAGLSCDALQHNDAAISYYERALICSNDYQELADELRYNLGRLCCEVGLYEQCIRHLENIRFREGDLNETNRGLRYLGMAYYRLSMNSEAIFCLQRALNHNEFDAQSMGLLGLLYYLEGQGDEVALSLCRKSVELEPDNTLLKLFLGEVLIANTLFMEARKIVQRCLRNKKHLLYAQILMVKGYKEQQMLNRAKYWLEKVNLQDTKETVLRQKINSLNEDVHGR